MQRFTTDAVQGFETEHVAAVRRLAPECAVLLKNDGMLPLAGAGKVALYGGGARHTIKGGTGSGDVNVRHFVTVEEGLENAGFEITSKAWLDAYDQVVAENKAKWIEGIKAQAKALGINATLLGMGKSAPEPNYELPLAAEGDTAIYVLARNSGEGADRAPIAGDIDLTETEIRDILSLNEAYEKFVLVLNVGGMVNLAPVAGVKSILLLGQLGTPTGDVCADLLLGKSSPSGKLTMTWAPIDAYPSTEGFGDANDTVYQEGMYVGYRYFDTAHVAPTYAFGYGLSYTDFQIDAAEVTANAQQVTVRAAVRNVGAAAGKEVVQVYVSAPAGKLEKPYQALAAFAKTRALAAGESETLTLTFATKDLASYDEARHAYVLEAGDYVVRVGNASHATKAAAVLTLDAAAVVSETKNICPGFDKTELRLARGAAEDLTGLPHLPLCAADFGTERIAYASDAAEIPAGAPVDWAAVEKGEASLDAFVAGLSNEQLARLCVGHYAEGTARTVIGSASTLLAGGAGETTHFLEQDRHVPPLIMADGPAGIRVSKAYQLVDGVAKSLDNPLASAMGDFLDKEELESGTSIFPTDGEAERDVPVYYQYCLAIPIGTCLAQSFNEALCEEMGDLVGDEMETFGVHYWLAPAMNIQRSPLCGRNFEYYSEDPLVSGKIGAAITRGVQKHAHCGTTIKHFAANNQETNRSASNSIVSERALREIYLKPFEISVKEAAPASVMTSYNLINGEHTCNSKDLLTYVLRDEWGYAGVVMTDWYATVSMMAQPNSLHGCASAAGCVKAGNNLTMSGLPSDTADILAAVDNPAHAYPLTRAELQHTARGVLEAVLRMTK